MPWSGNWGQHSDGGKMTEAEVWIRIEKVKLEGTAFREEEAEVQTG